MMLFTPRMIVDMISIQPDDHPLELQHHNRLVARIAPMRDRGEPGALLDTAERPAGQVAAPGSA